jgi:hypothetical protein
MPDVQRLQVLCYIPDAYHHVHGSDELMQVAPLCPDIDFQVTGGNGKWWPDPPENVSFTGWSDDMAGLLANSHVLLRRTPHDSFSAFVREGLVSGRHVIFTYDIPGVTFVRSGDTSGLKRALDRFASELQSDTLELNQVPQEFRHRILDTSAQALALANELR